MRVVVAGGRDTHLDDDRAKWLEDELRKLGATEVVTGGCRGIDQEAEEVAQAMGLETTTFRPKWDVHGRAAGPLRNAEMAVYAAAAIIFPGGRGTESMVHEMEKRGKKVVRLP